MADSVSHYSTSTQRIQELEEALAQTISYLLRLPPHPETYRAATAAQQVLDKEAGSHAGLPLNVHWQTLDGTTLMEGELHGDRLQLSAPVMKDPTDAATGKLQQLVVHSLREGLVIEFDAHKRQGSIKHKAFVPSATDEHQIGASSGAQSSQPAFLRALQHFAMQMGLHELVRIGLPRQPWYYVELPEEPYSDCAEPPYHHAWWLLTHLSGVLEQPARAPASSRIAQALSVPMPFADNAALASFAGPRLEIEELGTLLALMVKGGDRDEAMALLHFLAAYTELG